MRPKLAVPDQLGELLQARKIELVLDRAVLDARVAPPAVASASPSATVGATGFSE